MSVHDEGSGGPSLHPSVGAITRLARVVLTGDQPEETPDNHFAKARARHRARAERRRLVLIVGPAAVAVGVVALAVVGIWGPWSGKADRRMTWVVERASISANGYLQPAAAERPGVVRFSDGTELELSPGSRGRVSAVDQAGARVALESGRLLARVRPRPGARWSVDAGPFNVAVTGTVFELSWSGPEQVLELRLRTGEVVVRGPLTGESGIVLRPGQRLVARVREGRLDVEETRIEPPPVGGPPTAPLIPESAPDESAEPAGSSTAASAALAPRAWGWARRVGQGDFSGVLREARTRGVGECLKRCALPDLDALADAARYAAERDLAERALLAQRARFPRSSQAREAAFLLGRLAEDVDEDAAAAVEWYERYQMESPRGAYASEALGRKMDALRRAGSRERAREAAADYQRRFPAGPYAPLADELTRRP